MTTRLPITCKVADILSTKELALSAGKNHGVTTKTKFRIIGKIEIKLPDNPHLSETITFTKADLQVTYVGNYICVARTFREAVINPSTDNFAPDLPVTNTNPNWSLQICVGDIAEELGHSAFVYGGNA